MVINRRFWKFIIGSLFLVFIWAMSAWLHFLYTPLIRDENGLQYTVQEGSSIRSVIDDLAAQQIIKSPTFFKLLVHMKGVAHELKAGEYFFPKGTTSPKLLEQIITGSGMIYHSFMIVPGWNFKELRLALLHNKHLHHTLEFLSHREIMTNLGYPNLDPEGEFFPDTYYFAEGSQDKIILKRAFKKMQERLNTAWQHRAPHLPFKTPYEALIAASIIEKEAYLESELPKIAGVMVNRLKANMLLQFDPTVIYGVGERYTGKIRHSDLIADNPYNTYIHKGLPPTPISMPSLAAIDAILHPAQHHYLFFVAQKDGSSAFTQQLSDHNKAVALVRKSKEFFNYSLVRYHWLKLFSHTAIQ